MELQTNNLGLVVARPGSIVRLVPSDATPEATSEAATAPKEPKEPVPWNHLDWIDKDKRLVEALSKLHASILEKNPIGKKRLAAQELIPRTTLIDHLKRPKVKEMMESDVFDAAVIPSCKRGAKSRLTTLQEIKYQKVMNNLSDRGQGKGMKGLTSDDTNNYPRLP